MSSLVLRQIPSEFQRLPLDAPFLGRDCRDYGVTQAQLRQWTEEKLLVRPLRGVYQAADLADSIDLRVACVKLVAPRGAVVTDRTAAWLHGAEMALAPNDHLVVPQVSVFLPPGNRLRNPVVASGERRLEARDLTEIDGLSVTTPLRTACDVGRLLTRDAALGAMDAIHRLQEFSLDELVGEYTRFRGFRGVVQGRTLAQVVDGRAESPGESATRLRWYDAGLPAPELQWPVPGPHGTTFYLDLALPCCRYAVEYDGEQFHGPEFEEHDAARRAWIVAHGWTLIVLRRSQVYGQQGAIGILTEAALNNARRCASHRFY